MITIDTYSTHPILNTKDTIVSKIQNTYPVSGLIVIGYEILDPLRTITRLKRNIIWNNIVKNPWKPMNTLLLNTYYETK